eukprot:NODE_375_length_8520_cov_0.377390.p7 type:complete len:200 gc:universal NODE_375_length_8520_cov_0.377390:3403-4002(+)
MEWNQQIESVFSKIKRSNYMHIQSTKPQSIGFNATISAESIHASALHYLDIQPTDNILDIGCGSGYLTASFALLGHRVTGIDHIPELIQLSIHNIKKDNSNLLDKIDFICKDGRQGYLENAPYDKIYVGAACDEIYPSLLYQLKIGGKLLMPLNSTMMDYKKHQRLILITKTESGYEKKEICDVVFVPMTNKQDQLNEE